MSEQEPEERTCGGCGACCKMLGVKELAKPPGKRCAHFKRDHGCRIYEDRPTSCAEFICYWLRAPNLGPEWRPDRSGFVLHVSEGGRVLNVEQDPSAPARWRSAPYYERLLGWARGGADRALELRVWNGRRCTRLTPDGEEDLGLMRDA